MANRRSFGMSMEYGIFGRWQMWTSGLTFEGKTNEKFIQYVGSHKFVMVFYSFYSLCNGRPRTKQHCATTQTTLKMQIPEMVLVSRLVVDIGVRKTFPFVLLHTLNFSISLYPFVPFDISGCYWCCQRRRFTSFAMPCHAIPNIWAWVHERWHMKACTKSNCTKETYPLFKQHSTRTNEHCQHCAI